MISGADSDRTQCGAPDRGLHCLLITLPDQTNMKYMKFVMRESALINVRTTSVWPGPRDHALRSAPMLIVRIYIVFEQHRV